MAVWGIILIIFLLILLSVFIVLNVVTTTNNQKIAQTQTFRTFSSVIDPTTGRPTFPEGGSPDTPFTLADENGKIIPQIQCPPGQKINILGAFFDVFDPYATCSTTKDQVNPYFAFLCIPNHAGKTSDGNVVAPCNTAENCDKYAAFKGQLTCNSSTASCVLKEQPLVAGAPPEPPKGISRITDKGKFYFVNGDMCGSNTAAAIAAGNVTGVPNQFCSPNNKTTQCAIRDASATVAAKCNGKQECGNLTMADFGDYPCPGIAPTRCIIGQNKDGTPNWYNGTTNTNTEETNSIRSNGYCSLPYLQGFQGGIPEYGTGQSENPNYNHGYKMHGLFSCVAE